MLGTAQTDTLSAQLARLFSVSRCVCICTNLELSELICPSHNSAELACDFSVNRRDNSVVDVTCRAVNRDVVALFVNLAAESELLILLVHNDVAAARYTAGTHTARNNGCVRGHTAANGQNTLCNLHTGNILRRGLQTNQNNLFASVVPKLSVLSREYNLTASSAGRCAQALAGRSCSLQSLRVELRVQERVEVSRVDHSNSLLLVNHSLVNEVARNLQRSLSCSLTVSCLEHIELAALDCELHILHISVVILECFANLFELCKSLGELVSHLSNRHRSAHAGNNILALCIYKELTHKSRLAGCGVTRERNACTAVVTHITERHHLYVYGSTPRIGDIVVAAVNVRTGVIPRTEHSLNSAHKLLFRICREVLADSVLVCLFELSCKLLKVVSVKLDVLSNALSLLHLVDELLKVLLADLHNNVGIHLNKSSVAVPRPTGVI